ncbi:alpha/beta fold hydrolase [Niveibacterium sp. SC-1]|uniref:alpha/beta fold hydrolase n=1 Tax=Niveibacterium sp. SC-1 TaxID=3135646 RepID=UPI00311E3242
MSAAALPGQAPATSQGVRGDFLVGERRLHLDCRGQAGPTVIIESGGGSAGTGDAGWTQIRDALRSRLRICLYDRAGLGRSDAVRGPRRIEDFVGDLAGLLVAARIEPPYILVGASFGGLIAAHFATRHRDKVLGMLLLDAVHPRQWQRASALLPTPDAHEASALRAFREAAQRAISHSQQAGFEGLDLAATQLPLPGSLGAMPLTVLTAGRDEWAPGFPPELARALREDWLAMQAEMLDLSSRSRHEVLPDSGHCVHIDDSLHVIETILALAGH